MFREGENERGKKEQLKIIHFQVALTLKQNDKTVVYNLDFCEILTS